MTRLPLPTSSTASLSTLIPRSSSSTCTIVYASHARWPLPPTSTQPVSRPLRVAVLDSSFNPPHLAHLALATLGQHDALLLAFTVGNSDKGSVQSDVTRLRLEMVRAMAVEMQRGRGENVAVALMDAPTFVRKSRILKEELGALVEEQSGREAAPAVQLDFAVGYDTLLRIFAPRYYQTGPSLAESMDALLRADDSVLSCARRGDVSKDEERDFLDSAEVKPWANKIELFDLDEKVRGVSSTAIRQAVQEERWDEVKRDVPFPGVLGILLREGLYKE
ncbi:hypothetical protein JCM11641_003036 [Rhodosporidiobolus odoratus]